MTDDHTPPELLTYAVYLEKSSEQARTVTTPLMLIGGSEISRPEEFHAFIAHSWMDSPAYIAVSAIDFAGNEGPRSNVFKLSGGDSGCACHMQRMHRPAAATLVATLVALAWARRRARPRSMQKT